MTAIPAAKLAAEVVVAVAAAVARAVAQQTEQQVVVDWWWTSGGRRRLRQLWKTHFAHLAFADRECPDCGRHTLHTWRTPTVSVWTHTLLGV